MAHFSGSEWLSISIAFTRWHDINFDDKSLQVRRTVECLTGYGYIENEPKSSRGRRKITLPDFAIEVLKQHRVKQIEARLKVGEAWVDHDLVFCKTDGNFLPASTLQYQFEALLKDAGIEHIRFHDLRHSAATILLTMGCTRRLCRNFSGIAKLA